MQKDRGIKISGEASGRFSFTVVAEIITELIRFGPEICVSVMENWNSRENLYL